jgi:tagaturonate reductase
MKMRVRVVPSIVAYTGRVGRPPQSLAFGFASFLLLMRGERQAERRAKGLPVPADDGAERLKAHWAHAADDVRALVNAVCADVQLWSTDLSTVPGFVDAVAEHLRRAAASGVAAALDHHLAAPVS